VGPEISQLKGLKRRNSNVFFCLVIVRWLCDEDELTGDSLTRVANNVNEFVFEELKGLKKK